MVTKKRIAQIGTFDVENMGDLLFTDVFERYMKEYEIDLFSPVGGKKCFTNITVYPISSLEEKIKQRKYDGIVIGGGDLIRTDSKILINESSNYEKTSNPSLSLWAYPILLANQYQIPVLLNAIGIPNDFSTEESFFINKLLSMVDYLTVRDTEGQKTLERIGIFNSKLVPDSIIAISKLFDDKELDEIYNNLIREKMIPNLDNYLVFQHNTINIENDQYKNKLVDALKIISKKESILMMPIGYCHNDMEVLESLYHNKISNTYIVNKKRKLNTLEMLSILKHSNGYIGTSMHGAIISYSYDKKILILNTMNSKKLHGFANISNNISIDLNNIDNLMYVYYNHFGHVSNNNKNELIKKIDNHFNDMKKIVDNNKHRDSKTLLFKDIIKEYYEYVNSEIVIGCFYNNDDYLNRDIFKYNKGKNHYDIKMKNYNKNNIINPVINCYFVVDSLLINNILYNTPKIISSFFSLQIKDDIEDIKLELNGHIASFFEINNFFSEISKVDEYKKEIEFMKTSYKELEEKYCDYLKNN